MAALSRISPTHLFSTWRSLHLYLCLICSPSFHTGHQSNCYNPQTPSMAPHCPQMNPMSWHGTSGRGVLLKHKPEVVTPPPECSYSSYPTHSKNQNFTVVKKGPTSFPHHLRDLISNTASCHQPSPATLIPLVIPHRCQASSCLRAFALSVSLCPEPLEICQSHSPTSFTSLPLYLPLTGGLPWILFLNQQPSPPPCTPEAPSCFIFSVALYCHPA